MKRILLLVCPALLLLLTAAVVLPRGADRADLTVHEWGTFTSIAGEDGLAVPWRTYGGRQDLPCFVNTFGGVVKNDLSGTVRMETPVLYFYGSRDSEADVKVLFPKGTITEWYPQQSGPHSNTSVTWHNVRVSPDAAPDFPTGQGASHYYAARETDAAPLQVGSQQEKFLFYRGVGTFPLPLSAKATQDGKILMRNLGGAAIDGVMLFENRGGQSQYLFAGSVHDGEITLDRASLQSNWAGLLMDLERNLIEAGLYQKEARAMIETWRDSWFEEGTRLFYIVPKQAIDSILPLSIQPSPAETARVFVGRMEIITPEIQDDVRQALARNDRATFEKYGRFLEAIAKRIGARPAFLDSASTSDWSRAATCNN